MPDLIRHPVPYEFMKHHIFVAGTFDQLHDGHKHLLQETLLQGNIVTIGITSDEFLKKFKPLNHSAIQPFEKRKEQILEWLTSDRKVEIIAIDDPYEPAASGEYDALIVTKDNRQTGEEINQKRKANGLPELYLIEVTLVEAFDHQPISSTRIRAGQIDTQGNLYLPQSLRNALKEPMGEIIDPSLVNSHSLIIAVGDVTTDILLSKGILPTLSVIDLHAKRKPYKSLAEFPFPESITIHHVKSGPGFISKAAFEAIEQWSEKKDNTVIVVKGEDDLLVLPAILHAPEGSILYYGQPNVGLVKVDISRNIKEKAVAYLGLFVTE